MVKRDKYGAIVARNEREELYRTIRYMYGGTVPSRFYKMSLSKLHMAVAKECDRQNSAFLGVDTHFNAKRILGGRF